MNCSIVALGMPRWRRMATAGFTRVELIVMVAVTMAILAVVGVEIEKTRQRAKAICCNCNLKQVGLAFKTWALDHCNLFPMGVSTNAGGTLEYLTMGQVFRHYQAMSNELSTPRILVCPRDPRGHGTDFVTNFSNANLSYFVGILTNDALPQMFLSGDRNLTGGVWRASSILELTTNTSAGWSKNMHAGFGNVALADGSVMQFSAARLYEALRYTGSPTNQLAMP